MMSKNEIFCLHDTNHKIHIVEHNYIKFYICGICNPNGEIEERINGCYLICEECKSYSTYDNDVNPSCYDCGAHVCNDCKNFGFVDVGLCYLCNLKREEKEK